MRFLLTGATGFVGSKLTSMLDHPSVISRHGGHGAFNWDISQAPPPPEVFKGIDAVIHLSGEPITGRWTEERKARIRDSRVLGTRNLVRAMTLAPKRPAVLVSASAVGYYGDRGEERLTENSAPGTDFLADVCVRWEQEASAAETLGVRVVMLRTGIVLGRGGGALGRILPPFKLGLGGHIGGGRQWMPWIHINDLARLYLHAAAREGLRGPLNAVSPGVVRNEEFTRTLARALGRPAMFPVPGAALRLAYGELADTLLASQYLEPDAAEESGFSFEYPSLEAALTDCTR